MGAQRTWTNWEIKYFVKWTRKDTDQILVAGFFAEIFSSLHPCLSASIVVPLQYFPQPLPQPTTQIFKVWKPSNSS